MVVVERRGDAARAGIAGETGTLAPRLLRLRAPPACGASDDGEPGAATGAPDIPPHACCPFPRAPVQREESGVPPCGPDSQCYPGRQRSPAD